MKTKVETETPTVETPKSSAPVTEAEKIVKTAVMERKYKLVAEPSLPPKGKQRQIVLQILREAKGEPLSIAEVAKRATAMGLSAVGGVTPSCRYHLHHLGLMNLVEVVNPTSQTVAA